MMARAIAKWVRTPGRPSCTTFSLLGQAPLDEVTNRSFVKELLLLDLAKLRV